MVKVAFLWWGVIELIIVRSGAPLISCYVTLTTIAVKSVNVIGAVQQNDYKPIELHSIG